LSGIGRANVWRLIRRLATGLGDAQSPLMDSSPDRVERKLAAIFAADVAGYARLMSADESGTLHALLVHRTLIDQHIAQHGGRIANTAGDSVLAEFPSVVSAVECAIAVQQKLADANRGVPADKAIRFRIGIHVGDVALKGGDLLGDGVNVAARVQALAEPGTVWLSEDAYRHVAGKIDHRFEHMGERQVKNIARPLRVYAVARPLPRRNTDQLTEPGKPSVAVLPFTNMSDDKDTDYFADGMVEDIITGLSHFPWLFVIARNSSFTYKGRAVDVRRVGEELGVRYVLEGSVRRAGHRLRLTGQLIDARDGAHLWAERFDGRMEDVFELQDEMTAKVLGAIIPPLQAAEIERSKRSRPENLDAYDLYLRALAALREMTLAGSDEALALVDRALELEPDYAAAAGLGAWAYTFRAAQSWPVNRAAEKTRALQLGRLAILKARDDADALAAGGYTLAFLGLELEEGLRAIDRAISLNPNNAVAFAHAGWVHSFLGQPHRAIECVERSLRLSPRDPMMYRTQAVMAYAFLLLGDLANAVAWGERAVERNPNYTVTYRILISALAHADRLDEARLRLAQLVELVPGISIRTLAEQTVFKRSGKLDYILGGLRKAGFPE